MKVEIKKLDKLKQKIKVEVSGEEFLRERDTVYQQSSKGLKVPGFRPGSAPLEVLEKHHGKFLQEEFLKKSLPLFYQKALEENKLSPAGQPRIYDIECKPRSLIFSAEFETRPAVEVKESLYKGIKIKDRQVKVEEIEVEKVLTNLKEGIKKVTKRDLDDNAIARWSAYPDAVRLKETIRTQLFLEKFKERRRDIENQLRLHLLKAFKVDLPSGEAARYHRELVEREIYNLRLKGVPDPDIEKYKPDIEDKLKSLAEDEMKLFYIFEAIAKAEEIKIDSNLMDVVFGFILSQAKYQ